MLAGIKVVRMCPLKSTLQVVKALCVNSESVKTWRPLLSLCAMLLPVPLSGACRVLLGLHDTKLPLWTLGL
jgi:hypothetical protein